LYGGLALPFAGAFLVGVGVPLVWRGGFGDAGAPVAVLLAIGATLSLVFTGLAFLIALTCQDRAAGLAVAILGWLGATALYDGVVLLVIVALRDYPLERPLLAAMFVNPVDLARVLLLRQCQFDLGALAGYTGAAFERFFGTASGTFWSVAALAIWSATPFAVGLRQFSRKDF
jgi:Cu-processing system permease protein